MNFERVKLISDIGIHGSKYKVVRLVEGDVGV